MLKSHVARVIILAYLLHRPCVIYFKANLVEVKTASNRNSHQRYSVKKVLLKMSQISKESDCVRVFFMKFTDLRPETLLKWDSNTVAFLWIWEIFKKTYFVKHLRTAASKLLTLPGYISICIFKYEYFALCSFVLYSMVLFLFNPLLSNVVKWSDTL